MDTKFDGKTANICQMARHVQTNMGKQRVKELRGFSPTYRCPADLFAFPTFRWPMWGILAEWLQWVNWG